jgi:hypothetical protein
MCVYQFCHDLGAKQESRTVEGPRGFQFGAFSLVSLSYRRHPLRLIVGDLTAGGAAAKAAALFTPWSRLL